MAHRIVVTSVVVMVAMGSSMASGSPEEITDDNAKRVVEGNCRFAVQLYQKLREGDGNLFFSPYSISTALAMTYAGARGQTQQQMADTLRFPTSADVLKELDAPGTPMTQEQFAAAFGKIVKDLNARGGKDKYELRVANALWGQKDYAFLKAFVRLVEKQCGGKLQELDFVAATEKARRTINTWVEKQTNGKIKDLISQGSLDAMTRLVLTNAIYFKGNWARQFKEDRTRREPFKLATGGTVQVPMMNQKAEFGYTETDKLQALELPYAGKELSMVILLPKKVDGLSDLEQSLTAEALTEGLGRLRTREVVVSIPRFKMTSKFELQRVLRVMGMTDAFSRAADFSGMTGKRDLLISAVIHQAYVDVNEEGTEAAAATGVVMKLTSMGPDRIPVFRADHPFLFLIRDRTSDSVLFLGRVMNPTEG